MVELHLEGPVPAACAAGLFLLGYHYHLDCVDYLEHFIHLDLLDDLENLTHLDSLNHIESSY